MPEQTATAIPEIRCSTAADLLDKLRTWTIAERNGPPAVDRWVYRGQRDAAWALTPTAFRSGAVLRYTITQFRHTVTGNYLDSYEQGQGEFNAVYEFLHLADRVGLDVPGDSQVFRLNAEWENVVGNTIGTSDWPPPGVLETLAIAQHHGVPTRLLDFTYDPLVAAWFAAADVVAKRGEPNQPDRMAVWVLDLSFLYVGAVHNLGLRFIRVTVPRARSAYLHAQSGFFLYDKHAARENTPELNVAVTQVAKQLTRPVGTWSGRIHPSWKPGYKFTLPVSEAGELLTLPAVLKYDKARLQPSFDNVVEVLEAKRRAIHSQRP